MDDGPLRDTSDPANASFMSDINEGRLPSELSAEEAPNLDTSGDIWGDLGTRPPPPTPPPLPPPPPPPLDGLLVVHTVSSHLQL